MLARKEYDKEMRKYEWAIKPPDYFVGLKFINEPNLNIAEFQHFEDLLQKFTFSLRDENGYNVLSFKLVEFNNLNNQKLDNLQLDKNINVQQNKRKRRRRNRKKKSNNV